VRKVIVCAKAVRDRDISNSLGLRKVLDHRYLIQFGLAGKDRRHLSREREIMNKKIIRI